MCDTSTLMSTTQRDLHSCWIIYTKNDGKECLTVNNHPLLPANSTIMSSNAITKDMDESNRYLIDDEDSDVNDQSLTVMLDTEFQPEPPIPNNAESQQIYEEHQRLAKEYLRSNYKIYYAEDFRKNFLLDMEPEERQKKKELLKKMKERDELLELYNNLKDQIEKLRPGQIDSANPNNREVMADDGWVVVASNQNT